MSETGRLVFKTWAHPLMRIETLPSDEEISPFCFISLRLPIRVYNLPVLDKFSNAPLQNTLLDIVCNTPTYFVFCDYLLKKLQRHPFIDVFSKQVFLKTSEVSQENTCFQVYY